MESYLEKPTLVVLAGGESSRMGQSKSSIPIAGELVLSRIIDRINWPGPTILVLANHDSKPPGYDRFDQIVVDQVPGCGPLMGIYSALHQIKTDRAIFIPVDMPMLTRNQLEELAVLDGMGLLCRRTVEQEELIEPFPSIFRKESIDLIKSMLDQNRRSLHGLLKDKRISTFDATNWPAESWVNLNTPEDLARYEREFSQD